MRKEIMPEPESSVDRLTELQLRWLDARRNVSECKHFDPENNVDHRHTLCIVDCIHLTSMIGTLVNMISKVIKNDASETDLDSFFKDYRIPPCLLPMSERIIDFATDMSHVLRNVEPIATRTVNDPNYTIGD